MILKGENLILSVNDEILSCWRSVTFTIDTDTIGISTIGSGNWREYEASALSWSVSGEGQLHINETFTGWDLFPLQTALQTVNISWNVADSIFFAGAALITNVTYVGNVNDIASFNITMQGTGELTKVIENELMDIDEELIMDIDNETIYV